ncbi:MAG: PAS domain-containing protein, partial [Desulfobacteraceae bacterium]|nr:PAS domain-containing protein [Desulfobacteraceae bacterium]
MGDIDKEPDGAAVNKRDGYDLAFYKFIIDSLPIAVFTVNAEFKITGFNPWAEDVTGYSEKEVVGHYCSEIL